MGRFLPNARLCVPLVEKAPRPIQVLSRRKPSRSPIRHVHWVQSDVGTSQCPAGIGRTYRLARAACPKSATGSGAWALPHPNDGFLIDAGVLVGALELGELVDVGAHLAGELAFVGRAFHANDNALGI